ncbi:hypothetical protein GXP70_26690 [Paenibacillus lycopersici]|uniref:J domain-containing protein n=1 Tax=Paenibacillus lycopersici TaxID=2704462 RepID=A0A6C0G5Z2_9BACL|nr:hypothetical protein [Paenibacillus lycopersici]QHT63194.1 hypothetical protein GXP70_26690 [Paenibacillus lycopersici]
MGIWETLGIGQPTAEIAAIRKAYASQLKLHHPEDDPEGYQRLREAYDRALKLAKRQRSEELFASEQEEDTGQSLDPFARELAAPSAPFDGLEGESLRLFEASPASVTDAGTDPLDRFMARAAALYANFPARIQVERWTELLQEDVVWDLRLQPALVQRLLDFLDERYFLPAPVWELLTRTFEWLDASPFELHRRYPNVFNHAYDKAYLAAIMDYESLPDAGAVDYDAYLRHREAAWRALRDNELPAMKAELDHASPMYGGDPDLLYLQAAYCWRAGDSKGALAYIERFAALLPERYEHKEALSLAVSVFERNRRNDEARALRARINALNSRIGETAMAWRKPPRTRSTFRVKLWFAVRYTVLGVRWAIALLILAAIVVHAISSLGLHGGGHSIDPDAPGSIGQKLGNRNAPSGSKQVAVDLSDLSFTGVQEVVANVEGGERRRYIVYEDPGSLTEHPRTANDQGYIFVGYNKGITYYVSVNYELAAAITKSHRATVAGYEYLLFPEGLKAEVAANGIDRKPEANAQPFRYLLATLAVAR